MGEEKAGPPSEGTDKKDVYWARAGSESSGILVAAAWMLSKPRQFQKHTRLHASCGWDSLVAHPKILLLFLKIGPDAYSNVMLRAGEEDRHVPPWARVLAIRILDKLVQEVNERPRPIVFATFSGGLKSCLYQIFKILDESYDGVDSTLTKYTIVRDCYAGQIHDSSPVDFVSANGANFVSHPTILGSKKRIKAVTWSAYAVAWGLDFLLLPYFESARADMWNITYKTGAWGPVLILCSKDDELAPFEVIQNFSSRLSSLGCKVTMIEWKHSPHVGHLKTHPEEYRSTMAAFLSDVARSFALKTAHTSPDIDGTITGSITSSSTCNNSQKGVLQNQNLSSERPDSQTSSDGRLRVWIPSRM